ncbi:hypothetical protein LUZ60_007638 [Juncus effusus]|nr:hypothetical protein LUZ60_007638 [Juncus effusus]
MAFATSAVAHRSRPTVARNISTQVCFAISIESVKRRKRTENRKNRESKEPTMGERKVLNKYYPPDFDPAKIPRWKKAENQQMKVRNMLPATVKCGTCGNFMYKGTKFNCRKEDAVGEEYLGIQMVRFYFKCTNCKAEITFKTDPQNSDYTIESGASCNYEPWRNNDEEVDREKRKREEEEIGDAMKTLENKARDSKYDMDALASLEEMRSMKARHATVSNDNLLETLNRLAQQKEKNVMKDLDEQDEALIKSIVFCNSKDYVRRLNDDLLDDFETETCSSSKVILVTNKTVICISSL